MTDDRDRNARPAAILCFAVALGALGEFLFAPGLLGINVLLWTSALAATIFLLGWKSAQPLRGEGRWLLAPALLFAGFVAWRASPVLQAINLGSVAILLALSAFRLRDGRVRLGAVTEYLWLAALACAALVIGPFEAVFRKLDLSLLREAERVRHARPIIRGLVIAAPCLALFAVLLASADAIFSRALTSLFEFDATMLLAHCLRALLWTWVSLGFLFAVLVQEPDPLPQTAPSPALQLGPVEVSTLLGGLDLLFLAFVAFQVRYLFGGAGHVQVTDGLTYAEYARHGFFELLAVAALVLPLVLGVHWLLRDRSVVLRIAFRMAAAALILLLFVIIASALQRMRVYVDEFGLTELRLYTSAVMLWLVIVFAWLAATVLREQRQRFAFGALAAGMVVVAALNVLNPDAFIVRANLAGQRDFDTGYAIGLSPDATPTIAANLARIPADDRCGLMNDLAKIDGGDWRTWNLSRERARKVADTGENCDPGR